MAEQPRISSEGSELKPRSISSNGLNTSRDFKSETNVKDIDNELEGHVACFNSFTAFAHARNITLTHVRESRDAQTSGTPSPAPSHRPSGEQAEDVREPSFGQCLDSPAPTVWAAPERSPPESTRDDSPYAVPVRMASGEAEDVVADQLDSLLQRLQSSERPRTSRLRAVRRSGRRLGIGSLSHIKPYRKLKPDAVILQEAVKDVEELVWENVEILVEVTLQQSQFAKKCLQAIYKLQRAWHSLWGRHQLWALICFPYSDKHFLVTVNHATLSMCPMDASDLTQFFDWYLSATPMQRGFDSRFGVRGGRITLTVAGTLDTSLTLKDVLSCNGQLIGRNTKVGLFIGDTTQQNYIVKDAWTQVYVGRGSEKEVLTRLEHIPGTPDLAPCQPPSADPLHINFSNQPGSGVELMKKMIAVHFKRTKGQITSRLPPSSDSAVTDDMRSSNHDETPPLKRQRFGEPGHGLDSTDSRPGQLRHETVVLVSEPEARTLAAAVNEDLPPRDLITVMRQWIEILWACFYKARVLHGDITPNNLLISGSKGSLRASLIDFDYSYDLDDQHQVLPSLRSSRSGVYWFICSAILSKRSPAPRSFHTDLDSFWWVFLWYPVLTAGHRPAWIKVGDDRPMEEIVWAKNVIDQTDNLQLRLDEMNSRYKKTRFQATAKQFYDVACKPFIASKRPNPPTLQESQALYHQVIGIFDDYLQNGDIEDVEVA